MKQAAFSLVELSIVLVILGLLTGGVLGGRSLIKAAELRAIPTELARYSTASHAFRDKYFGFPGDLANATQFWGIAAGSTGTDTTSGNFASTDRKTCNGDGDGVISDTGAIKEHYRAWQHLVNAGLVEGFYPGTTTNPTRNQWPNSRYPKTAWSTASAGPATTGSIFTFDVPAHGNSLTLHRDDGYVGAIVAEDAWTIDNKMDDGRPQFGKVLSIKGSSFNPCSTTFEQPTTADATATYNLTHKGANCSLHFFDSM